MNGTRRPVGALLIAGGVVGIIAASYLVLIAWAPVRGVTKIDEAVKVAKDYLNSLNNKDLAIDEIEEYQYNFYVVYYERGTNMGSFEMIIDKPGTGGSMWMWSDLPIGPEPGPNMMWNTKYGMMGGSVYYSTTGTNTITVDQAKTYAQRYLDNYVPGAKVGDVRTFYGYHTIDIVKDGKIYGMLSVNAYNGIIWYHDWHGAYIQTREMKSD